MTQSIGHNILFLGSVAYIAYCLKTKKFGSWITWLSLSCLIFHHCPEDFERELSKIESKNVWDKKYVDLDGEQFLKKVKKCKSQDKIRCRSSCNHFKRILWDFFNYNGLSNM